MLDRVRVAAAAVDTKPGQLAENLEKLIHWSGRAASEGARLVLFPELSLTGFIPNHPTGEHESWLRRALAEARQLALPLDCRPLTALAESAKRHNILICAGLLEDAGNLLHNAHVLIGPQGLIGHWRKLHVPMFETPFYNGGQSAPVVETPLARIGVNICFDALIPESTRLLAVQNVELVLMPFAADPPPATPAGWASWAGAAIRARAVENGVFVVASNYVGSVECAGARQQFPGGGMIVSPRGETLAEWTAATGECGLIVADLEAAALASARAEPEYLYRFRRPELYGPLTRHGE
ncbi:MAG: carbon-nitrogen hydrolase family protein [Pirellulales bacterium]|nr:carbon-nitrogen hydrolase family protein [Pirellulales bacterium]